MSSSELLSLGPHNDSFMLRTQNEYFERTTPSLPQREQIVYLRKMAKKKPTKQTWKVNVRKKQ